MYSHFVQALSLLIMGVVLLIQVKPIYHHHFSVTFSFLGWFGLLHGSSACLAMFLTIEGLMPGVLLLQTGLLIASFAVLLSFGVQMVSPHHPRWRWLAPLVAVLVSAALLLTAPYTIRYVLGVPAALLAGSGLLLESHRLKTSFKGLPSRGLMWAGMALCLYGLSLSQPLEAFQAVLTVVMMFGIVTTLRAMKAYDQHQLEAARDTERELHVALRELSLLYEAASLLTAHQDLDTLITNVLQRIVQIVEPVEQGMIVIMHPKTLHVKAKAAVGVPIATGVIEGACRHLVKDRFERSGMQWAVPGAQGMLQLRSVDVNDDWDDFQRFRRHHTHRQRFGSPHPEEAAAA